MNFKQLKNNNQLKEISEDDKFLGLEKLQSLLDEHVKKIEEFAATKEKEILER